MLKKCNNVSRVWLKLTTKKRDGTAVNIQIMDLPNDRFEDFMDFKMKYFVRHEITHQVAGIPNSVKAMSEYREYFTNIMKDNPLCKINICCPEQNGTATPEIVGISAMRLISGDNYSDYDTSQLKTKEMRRFFEILQKWNNLNPAVNVMKKYGINRYYDGIGMASHPDYTKFGYWIGILRRKILKTYAVPLTGAWMTSPKSLKGTLNAGWEPVFEISYDDLAKKLGINFENPPPVTKYLIAKPLEK